MCDTDDTDDEDEVEYMTTLRSLTSDWFKKEINAEPEG